MRLVVWAVALLSLTPFALLADEPSGSAEPLGLVKERPTEGRFVETVRGFMVPYTVKLPLKAGDVEPTFTMVPVPGGAFRFGSPESESGREPSEGPAFEVKIEPFWIADKEVSWAEYQTFMAMTDIFVNFAVQGVRPIEDPQAADVISSPSNLYEPSFTYVNGQEPNLPAATMSQFAARQYTKWLSLLTGRFYRLPSEAEWEYAARANTDGRWFFGDDASKLGDYAWYEANSAEATHPVGQKLPSPWGLYDIYGNVAEWTLDAYTAEGYAKAKEQGDTAGEVLQWPTTRYPRSLRGGSYAMEAGQLRSASRWGSDDDAWREQDPNYPQSPWWLTESPTLGVGMRIVRPLNPPTDVEAKERFWKAGIDDIQDDVDSRISDGKGALGRVDPDLPAAKAASGKK